jgi:3-deoxy-D-manno-octulosonic-acid transferase
MLHLLYNFLIHAYSFIINIIAPFNSKAKFWVEGRKNIFERLGSASLTNLGSTSLAWFHCASLGEFEQGRPVIEDFRVKYPAYKILVTFFSPSGYEIRKNYTGADFIF